MGYVSRRGRRPAEYASKSAHGHVVNDPAVQNFLAHCNLPKRAADVQLPKSNLHPFTPVVENPIQHIIAIDGGYSEVAVQKEFPSATVCFFQFGALVFSVDDLEKLDEQPFIDPDDIAKLKRIQRLKLILPVRNVALKREKTLTRSVRRAVYDFFCQNMDDGKLIETMCWFLYQEYGAGVSTWTLASCPSCDARNVPLERMTISRDYTFACPQCQGQVFLTDVFRLHEVIDDELGAGGILAYLTTAVEQLILVHLIRILLKTKPALLKSFLFIKDGPLAFFGQTSNMHKPMRALTSFLFKKHNLYLAGLEKSGSFVEHADEIANLLEGGSILLLDDDYIYQYILPGRADPANPYGSSTYYSSKLIFKTTAGHIHVVTVPVVESKPKPSLVDLNNLLTILTNVEKLRCDMYDYSLIPVALVNKLVSLADHPSSGILQKFAMDAMKKKT